MLTSLALIQPNSTHSDPALLLCVRDPGPLIADQAHRDMQVHLECDVDTCKARRRARATLGDSKRMVLDDRATRAVP
ncbi:hypothetical protein ACIGO9_31360 [Nocardia asteroides]|uniref:hypothetical protein n=1 Tax=Nocardia asteroides TaxID=1824 RepID=UPI0037C9A758